MRSVHIWVAATGNRPKGGVFLILDKEFGKEEVTLCSDNSVDLNFWWKNMTWIMSGWRIAPKKPIVLPRMTILVSSTYSTFPDQMWQQSRWSPHRNWMVEGGTILSGHASPPRNSCSAPTSPEVSFTSQDWEPEQQQPPRHHRDDDDADNDNDSDCGHRGRDRDEEWSNMNLWNSEPSYRLPRLLLFNAFAEMCLMTTISSLA